MSIVTHMRIQQLLPVGMMACVFTTASALELGAPFADHAILQRGMPVPVWGWGTPGSEVTVEFAGTKKTAEAAEDGSWTITLDALDANAEPQTMVVSEDGGKSITLGNLLVGEVWMASGQSNMQWIASKSSVVHLVNALKEKGESPPIRESKVGSVTTALHPIRRASGAWQVEDFGNFSAVAFAFALKLHEELGVPIGILNCSFSETSIEAWTPREGFADAHDEISKGIYQKLLQTDPSTTEHKAAWDAFYQSLETTIHENAELLAQGKPAREVNTTPPGNLRGNRDATWLYNGRMSPVVPYAIRGAIWNQGYANMGGGFQYYHNLHNLIRGWRKMWDREDLPVYFNQFYYPGNLSQSKDTFPGIGKAADMRMGTWMARDIPHTGMASQVDVEGAVHYYQKTQPARRLALHALKNQYGKPVVADGPMHLSHKIDGNKVIVQFEHADGGLVVGETFTNALSKPPETSDGLATPVAVPAGDALVNHFWLAGVDRVWHPATMRIDGTSVVVTSPAVKEPRGISYATGGVGFRHGLYNKAMLPATPFMYFDGELVTEANWPDAPMKIAGVEIDPSSVGKAWNYRRFALLSTQFRDHAVLQADVPVTVFGSTILYPGHVEEGECVVHFKFDDIEQTIPVEPGMEEWSVTLPPHPAGTKPHTLHVAFLINGNVVHERHLNDIIFGDVWYVASPPLPRNFKCEVKPSNQTVRAIRRVSKRAAAPRVSRFSVATSAAPVDNRFASFWFDEGEDPALAIGHRIAAKTGRPTGVIFMDSGEVPLAGWMSFEQLKNAPSLAADYKDLAQLRPGNEHYDANVRRFIASWRTYWSDYIPHMIATGAVPDGANWGPIPAFGAEMKSKASHTHNVLTASFVPGSAKGILFLTGPGMVAHDEGADFAAELTALANGWVNDFGGNARFVHTRPDASLAPKFSQTTIPGATAIPVRAWDDFTGLLDAIDAMER